MIVYNKKIDFLFIKFPIIFPLIYGLILFNFPTYENLLIIVTILFLAEPHFAATYPILFDNSNKDYLKSNKIIFYFGSLIIFFYCFVGFFLFKNLFLLSFFAYNMYHVTRQSIGTCKLFSLNQKEFNFQKNYIYFFNIIFFFIGLARFYNNYISENDLLELNLILISILVLISVIFIVKFNFSENFFTFISGIIIFYPICFVSNPVHAILFGVTMHYSQYLLITFKVYAGRKEIFKSKLKKKIFLNNFFLIIGAYASFMTVISLLSKNEVSFYQNLILIPIIGQILHFYLDTFIWRFREEHNRVNTLKYIKE